MVGPIDLAALARRTETPTLGTICWPILRTEAYPAYQKSIYPPGRAHDGVPTADNERGGDSAGSPSPQTPGRPVSISILESDGVARYTATVGIDWQRQVQMHGRFRSWQETNMS